ncbi:hypothetical protein POM88_022319 [Heracleum sosnowskyi]|uniref:CCHC-type domain-containing protein n=1 Tax=Heracleum sosnowskyi TaxID=360622 RepID=A0AAD8IGJ5_9APIA|nr:hypothetical protein POM88_022319 [Heracleum sosnowskyi]
MEKMDNPIMAYMAKKFKNIRFKRNKPYKSQGQTSRFSKGSSSKVEGGATRGGYKTGIVDRSKFRCYNCNELDHFATKCRRPKQTQRMDKGSSGHFKKGQGKAYVAGGKCWDDSDEEEEEEYVNLALMAKSDEISSSSSNQVPSLVLLEMSKEEYKQSVEELSAEMFNVHTSLTAANEEIARLTKLNETLTSENDMLLLKTSRLESLSQENAKLKNELVCAKEIEKFIRNEISENEFKIKAYRNSSKQLQEYHEKHTEDQRVGICFEYGRRPGNEIVDQDCSNDVSVKPHVLKKINKPIFKLSELEFDEEAMLIKQQLDDEDADAVSNGKTVTSKDTVKRASKTVTSKPTVKIEGVKGTVKKSSTTTSEHLVDTVAYKSKNINGKLGNGNANVGSAPRKLCNNCGSSHHLTHVCKKPKEVKDNVTKVNGNVHRTHIMHRSMVVCNNTVCMPCKITAMSTCFNMPISSTEQCLYMQTVESFEPTGNSKKAASTKKKTKSNSKAEWVKKEVQQKIPDVVVKVENGEYSCDTEVAGPNKAWVPYAS